MIASGSNNQSLFRSYLEEAQKGRSQFLLSPSVKGRVDEKVLAGWKTSLPEGVTVLHGSGSREHFSPYYPLMDWVQAQVKDYDPEQLEALMAQADVYSFHRPLLVSWLSGRRVNRQEEVISNEANYEKRMMHRSVWKLFFQVFPHQTLLLIFDELQAFSPSTLELLIRFKEEEWQYPVVFFFHFEMKTQPLGRRMISEWNRFLEIYEDHKIPLFLIEGDDDPHKREKRFSLKSIPGTLERLRVNLEFFCYAEAEELGGRLYGLYTQNKFSFRDKERNHLFELLGDVDFFYNDYLQALVHWGYLMGILKEAPDAALQCRLSWKMARARILQGEFLQGRVLAEKALAWGEESGDKRGIFYALFAYLLAEESLRDVDFELWRVALRKFLGIGQEEDYPNAMAYWLVNPYMMNSPEYLGEASYYQDWGVELCEKHKNHYRLAEAWLQRGNYWTVKGDWDRVLDCYEKSETLKRSVGSGHELPHVFNGRGYFLLKLGQHMAAQENFIEALEGLKILRNFMEMGLTIFNLAKNSFISGNYSEATHYFTKLLKLLTNMNLTGVTYHTKYEILIFLALSYLRDDKISRALESWIKAQEQAPSQLSQEEACYTYLFRAEMLVLEKNPDEAEKLLREGENFLMERKKDLLFLVPYYFIDMGQIFRKWGREDEALLIFKKGYMESFQIPNTSLRERLHRLLNGSSDPYSPPKLPAPLVDFDWIIESAKQELSFRELQKHRVELDLMRRFQSLLLQSPDEEDLVAETMRLFQKNFVFDGVYLFLEKNGHWSLVYGSTGLPENIQESLEACLPGLRKKADSIWIRDTLSHGLTKESFLPFSSLISIHASFLGELQGQLICGLSPELGVSHEDLETLGSILRLLLTSLGRRDREKTLQGQNEKLLKASNRDLLTGLPNRRAFHNRLSEEIERLERYGSQATDFSLLFLDIDGLSQVNNKFGHLGGDLVLKSFSRSLDRVVRLVDVVCRFGGDEFMILLPETDVKGAEILAERIINRLWDVEGYGLLLQEEFPDVNVEELPLLSCSIGLTTYNRDGDILRHVDLALLEAKQAGGGRYCVFHHPDTKPEVQG